MNKVMNVQDVPYVDYGDPQPTALGPCGCVDYHMADCPTLTGGSDMSRDDYMDLYENNRELFEDEWY